MRTYSFNCVCIIYFSSMPNIDKKVQFQNGILLVLNIWIKKLVFFLTTEKNSSAVTFSNIHACQRPTLVFWNIYACMHAIGTKSSGVKYNIVSLKINLHCLWGWANLCIYVRNVFKFYWESPIPHCKPNYISVWKKGQRRIFPFGLYYNTLKFSCHPF